MDNVKGSLKHPIFAVDLKRGAPGSYQFGDVDTSKYTGAITYAPVHPQRSGHWEFDAAGYAVGNDKVTAKTLDTVADTGSSLNYFPSDVVKAYYARVPGATYDATDESGGGFGGWTFPCNAKQPDFTLAIGSHRATMPGAYNVFSPKSDGSKGALRISLFAANDRCLSTVPLPVTNLWLTLGDASCRLLRLHPAQRWARLLPHRRGLPQVAVRRLQRR